MSENVPTVVIEHANILLRAAKQGHRGIAWHLVDMLTDSYFKMKTFNWYIGILADCEDITTTSTKDPMKDDGFCRVLVRGC